MAMATLSSSLSDWITRLLALRFVATFLTDESRIASLQIPCI
jgi:hypothetical protein